MKSAGSHFVRGVLALGALALPACKGSSANGAPSASAAVSSASAANPLAASAAPMASASSARRPPPPPLEPPRFAAQHLMTCLSDIEPTVCPWWESVMDVPTTRKMKHDCEGGDALGCLVLGLASIGQKNPTDAGDSLIRSCEGKESLACVYLAYTHLVCSRTAMRGSATCGERLENYLDDKKSETTLVKGCEEGLGSACYVLGHVLWPREDNKFPSLERGCRFGVVGSCELLYDELRDVTKQPVPQPRRLGWVKIRLMELCDADAVDCYDIARDLAEMTHMPTREFLDRACDPKRIPHMPKALCGKDAGRATGPGPSEHAH